MMGDGVLHYTRADPTSVGYLMVSNLTQSVVYRELDAAARAYLDQSDAAPLLRLIAENNTSSQSGGAAFPSNVYSQAIFVSVSCSDYPQIYDMHLGRSRRKLQRDGAIAKQKQIFSNIYSPLTIDEFDQIPLDTSVLDLCLSWPAPVVTAYSPGYPVSPSTHFTKAPVFVLSGDMDSLTPALQGKRAARSSTSRTRGDRGRA